MNTDVMFSQKTGVVETPHWLFDRLNAIYHFDLDAAALPENAKCADYFTPETDGLKQQWRGNVWLNPPYGRGIADWCRKAHEEVRAGRARCVVMLLPARTDTEWFSFCQKHALIQFMRGRLKFENTESSAPFPSLLVIFMNLAKE